MGNKDTRVSGDGLSREDKIKRIYEVISDKSFKKGCEFVYNGYTYTLYNFWSSGELEVNGVMLQIISKEEMKSILDMGVQLTGRFDLMEEVIRKNVDIIGHPVMIGDVLDWGNNAGLFTGTQDMWNNIVPEKVFRILAERKEKRKPIEEQTNKCVDYVYSLLETNQPTTS